MHIENTLEGLVVKYIPRKVFSFHGKGAIETTHTKNPPKNPQNPNKNQKPTKTQNLLFQGTSQS